MEIPKVDWTGFVFHVTHLNGLNPANPFDDNPASVALDSLVRTIEINILKTLCSSKIPGPIKAVNEGTSFSGYIL